MSIKLALFFTQKVPLVHNGAAWWETEKKERKKKEKRIKKRKKGKILSGITSAICPFYARTGVKEEKQRRAIPKHLFSLYFPLFFFHFFVLSFFPCFSSKFSYFLSMILSFFPNYTLSLSSLPLKRLLLPVQ